MPRLLGHIPSPDHHVGLGPLMGLQLTAGPLPSEAIEPLPDALSQDFNDCVANSSGVSIVHGAWAAMGRPAEWPELPSRMWLYAVSRLNAGQQLTDDDGTYIFSLFQSVALVGYPRESQWTYGRHHLSMPPDLEVVRNSADQRLIVGARRIVSTGQQRVNDVCVAIAGGSTVVLGTRLDQPFSDLGPNDVWPGVRGQVIGGHAMVCHGYRTNQFGKREFLLRSSWGKAFGFNGSVWISEDAMASRDMSDLWIVERAAEYSA